MSETAPDPDLFRIKLLALRDELIALESTGAAAAEIVELAAAAGDAYDAGSEGECQVGKDTRGTGEKYVILPY